MKVPATLPAITKSNIISARAYAIGDIPGLLLGPRGTLVRSAVLWIFGGRSSASRFRLKTPLEHIAILFPPMITPPAAQSEVITEIRLRHQDIISILLFYNYQKARSSY